MPGVRSGCTLVFVVSLGFHIIPMALGGLGDVTLSTMIALESEQIGNFAANTLELTARDGRVLALSRRALGCLTQRPRRLIERSAQLLPLDVPTIEIVGGSVRCMLAGIHLARRE